MAPESKKLPLRPNVCMLVYNRDGKLLLGERINRKKHWQFPQGGAEAEYSLRENVIRELKEELGIKRSKLGKITKLTATNEYEWRNIPKYARGRWRGQTQTFWLVEFRGTDEDIVLDGHHEPEFRSFRWCSPTMVKRLAAKERLPGYLKALKEFSSFIPVKKRAAPAVKKGERHLRTPKKRTR